MGEEDIETNVGEKTIDLTIVTLLEYGSLNVLGFFFFDTLSKARFDI